MQIDPSRLPSTMAQLDQMKAAAGAGREGHGRARRRRRSSESQSAGGQADEPRANATSAEAATQARRGRTRAAQVLFAARARPSSRSKESTTWPTPRRQVEPGRRVRAGRAQSRGGRGESISTAARPPSSPPRRSTTRPSPPRARRKSRSGYTKIVAPVTGRVTRRTVQKTATSSSSRNLSSSRLVEHDLVGHRQFQGDQAHRDASSDQAVEIAIDTYPDRHLAGHIDSLPARQRPASLVCCRPRTPPGTT